MFKENPGGEFRKSYHGYPSGFAQLIASPTQWLVEPMQIDTHNRNYGLTEQVGYKPWHLPTQMSNATITELRGANSGFSPLLECPCTTRISRHQVRTSDLLTGDSTCGAKAITGEADCAAAIAPMARVLGSTTVHDPD